MGETPMAFSMSGYSACVSILTQVDPLLSHISPRIGITGGELTYLVNC